MSDAAPSAPGWYADPDVPDQLRYFDGILWTSHVTPLRTRSAAPVVDTVVDARPRVANDSPTRPAGTQPRAEQGFPMPSPAPAPPWAPTGPTAADGTPLAPLGLRVVGYVLDALIVNVLALVAGGWFLYRAVEPVMPALTKAMAGNDAQALNAAIESIDTTLLGLYTGVKLLVTLGYGLFSLTRWSATPAMLALGISVRRSATPGVLGWDAASRRVGFQVVLDAATNLPLLGLAALLVKVFNLLRPFRDPQRRALHDVVADTIVVPGRQPR